MMKHNKKWVCLWEEREGKCGWYWRRKRCMKVEGTKGKENKMIAAKIDDDGAESK